MNAFNSENNQKMLFSILTDSKINLFDPNIKKIVQETFKNILKGPGPPLNINPNSISLMSLNKLFIKLVMEKKEKFYKNPNFYKNKDELKKENQLELQKKIEIHQNDLDNLNKKRPDEIDFKDKDWKTTDYGSINDKINQTIAARTTDLKLITKQYSKQPNQEDFQNDSKWLKQFNKKNDKKNIKIMKDDVKINPEIIKEDKRVRFSLEDNNINERMTKLEKEVSEIRRLIKDVLSEKLMKNSVST